MGKLNLFEVILMIGGLLIVFTNIIIGITVLPIIVDISSNKYTPLLSSLGIILQAIFTLYFIVHHIISEEGKNGK